MVAGRRRRVDASGRRRGRRVEGARDLLGAVALDQVADLDVVEVLDADAALEALADLAHVVLEAPQRRDRAVVHLRPVADYADAPLAVDDPAPHRAARDDADLRHLERLAHLRLA